MSANRGYVVLHASRFHAATAMGAGPEKQALSCSSLANRTTVIAALQVFTTSSI